MWPELAFTFSLNRSLGIVIQQNIFFCLFLPLYHLFFCNDFVVQLCIIVQEQKLSPFFSWYFILQVFILSLVRNAKRVVSITIYSNLKLWFYLVKFSNISDQWQSVTFCVVLCILFNKNFLQISLGFWIINNFKMWVFKLRCSLLKYLG